MEGPELTNFATLVRVALELEARAAVFYESSSPVGPIAAELAAQHRERAAELERARRQFLNEVALEPIPGLDPRSYTEALDTEAAYPGRDRALLLEEAAARFYEETAKAAEPVLLEAARVFRRLGQGNRANLMRLRSGMP